MLLSLVSVVALAAAAAGQSGPLTPCSVAGFAGPARWPPFKFPAPRLEPALARTFGDVQTQSAERRLADIQQELMKAWIARDRKTIELLLAPDWSVTGPTGTVTSRAEVLADAFERDRHRVLSGSITDVSVRMIGADAAVVTGRTKASGTYAGAAYAAEIRFTDVFERHAGDWRAVRSHASSITP